MSKFSEIGSRIDALLAEMKTHAEARDASAQAAVDSEAARLEAERKLIEANAEQDAAFAEVQSYVAGLAPLPALVVNQDAALDAKAEAERLAAEEAARVAEQERLAAEAAAQEAERIAAEQAEAQRLADEAAAEAARLEAERIAAEQAAQPNT